MEYRTVTPADNGFEDEADERAALRGFIQDMMQKAGPADLLDTVLVVTNICELRALLHSQDAELHRWYRNTALMLRSALDIVAGKPAHYKPLDKLEDQSFYFPDTDVTH